MESNKKEFEEVKISASSCIVAMVFIFSLVAIGIGVGYVIFS